MFNLSHLPYKRKDEEIIFFLRRHWLILLRIFVVYGFLAALPIVFYWLLNQQPVNWLENDELRVFLNLLVFGYYLFWWMLLYRAWLDYFLDIWIVTTHRVINIEQRGLFNRFIAEHKLFKIQDVVSKQKGIVPTLFNYGEIHIQTAGTEKTVVFEQVPQPHKFARQIIRLIEWRRKELAKKGEKIDRFGKNII